ncbi:MAG TPA: hypothetical protein VMV07_11380 [Streptosporangiaceae bacterium]|nr:hypothetical protein [Streptosporangiaceae bacterium]
MPTYKVRVNGTAEFEVASSATSASMAADEIMRYTRQGDGSEREIRLFLDRAVVVEVTKVSDQP